MCMKSQPRRPTPAAPKQISPSGTHILWEGFSILLGTAPPPDPLLRTLEAGTVEQHITVAHRKRPGHDPDIIKHTAPDPVCLGRFAHGHRDGPNQKFPGWAPPRNPSGRKPRTRGRGSSGGVHDKICGGPLPSRNRPASILPPHRTAGSWSSTWCLALAALLHTLHVFVQVSPHCPPCLNPSWVSFHSRWKASGWPVDRVREFTKKSSMLQLYIDPRVGGATITAAGLKCQATCLPPFVAIVSRPSLAQRIPHL